MEPKDYTTDFLEFVQHLLVVSAVSRNGTRSPLVLTEAQKLLLHEIERRRRETESIASSSP